MEENHIKTLSILLKFVLLLQLVYSIHHQNGAEAAPLELHDRMSNIEAQNHRHEKEISLLKTEKMEDRKEIHQLRERVALLEDATFSNASSGEKILTRSERPARLLPPSVLRPKKKKNETEEVSMPKIFYGPPRNCSELQQLGYTLNGYYLVKGQASNSLSTNIIENNKIGVVYCQFKQQAPKVTKPTLETLMIGNVDIKTKNVHFYAQRSKEFRLPTKGGYYLNYQYERLNVGGAMNKSTGIFSAPVAGIYHFDFNTVKSKSNGSLKVFLQINDRHRATALLGDLPNHLSASITGSWSLKAKDKVKILVFGEDNGVLGESGLYDDRHFYTHFAGWLVDEDLVLA